MEIRARNVMMEDDDDGQHTRRGTGYNANIGSGRGFKRAFLREMDELWRAAVRMIKGRGSVLGYLLIPAIISLLWLLVAIVTTRGPTMSLEDRLSKTYVKVRERPQS